MIRDINLHDLMLLEPYVKFPLGSINNPTYCIKKSVENDGKLIGSFLVKATTETSLVFNEESSSLNKARALREVFKFLSQEIVKLGFNDNHIFLNNLEYYEKLLKKHFGFENIIGTPLVLRGKE